MIVEEQKKPGTLSGLGKQKVVTLIVDQDLRTDSQP
jgi:hypothetical protein